LALVQLSWTIFTVYTCCLYRVSLTRAKKRINSWFQA